MKNSLLEAIFGYETKKNPEIDEKKKLTFSAVEQNDGTLDVESYVDFVSNSKFILDLDAEFESEKERINAYRRAARTTEMSDVIDEIVNEAIVVDESESIVDIELSDTEFSSAIKNKITDEFEYILGLMKFNKQGDEIFKRWYIDGKHYFHKIVSEKNIKNGIIELRYLDPRRVKKVRETIKNDQGTKVISTKEYYVYSLSDPDQKKNNPTSVHSSTENALEITPDMITYTHSGLLVEGTSIIESYLHSALKPLNQLMNLEHSVVVYRVARAPERRIFYVDVGNLPKTKAEQYMRSITDKYKNKISYNASTGTFTGSKDHMSMLEDIWLPRREGNRGTEVSTLDGGQSLGELDDVLYFRKKFYKAMRLPQSRLEEGATFNLGRASEISRDEIKFSKFIKKLQTQFSHMFIDILKTQLILKGIITPKDWEENVDKIYFQFNTDSYFSELKESEIMNARLESLRTIDEYVGKYFSPDTVMKKILRMSEEEIKAERESIAQAIKDKVIPDPNAEDDNRF